jgi:hypothetical protein
LRSGKFLTNTIKYSVSYWALQPPPTRLRAYIYFLTF